MSDETAMVFGHLFYAHPHTAMAQCQGYTGLHVQIGTLAVGVMPYPWKDRGGLNLFIGLFTPRQRGHRRNHFLLRWHPRGGPNGEVAKAQRAKRLQKTSDGVNNG